VATTETGGHQAYDHTDASKSLSVIHLPEPDTVDQRQIRADDEIGIVPGRARRARTLDDAGSVQVAQFEN
jgi:hypothetical protein